MKKKAKAAPPPAPPEDDLFSLGIPLSAGSSTAVKASPAAASEPSLSPLEQIQQLELAADAAAATSANEHDGDELSLRAVLNRAKDGRAAGPLLHPIDATRRAAKSAAQIKQQRLERKAQRNSALKHGSGTRTEASIHVAFKQRQKAAGGSLQATLVSLQKGVQS